MRFWDSSALMPLLVEEAQSDWARGLMAADAQLLVWWSTELECSSALARAEREGGQRTATRAAFERLSEMAQGWETVGASDEVRRAAIRFVRVHPLRAADALQLAAAFTAAQGRTHELEFVTLDARLAEAAGKEGFRLLGSPPY